MRVTLDAFMRHLRRQRLAHAVLARDRGIIGGCVEEPILRLVVRHRCRRSVDIVSYPRILLFEIAEAIVTKFWRAKPPSAIVDDIRF